MSAKYDRQIDILSILMRGGRTTVYKISCETGVCTHTVKRDISDLAYHFPIFTYAGRGGVSSSTPASFSIRACYAEKRFSS